MQYNYKTEIFYTLTYGKGENPFVIVKTVKTQHDTQCEHIFHTNNLKTAFAQLTIFRSTIHKEFVQLNKETKTRA